MYRPKSAPALRKVHNPRKKTTVNFLLAGSKKRGGAGVIDTLMLPPRPTSNERSGALKSRKPLTQLSPLSKGVRANTNFTVNSKKKKKKTVKGKGKRAVRAKPSRQKRPAQKIAHSSSAKRITHSYTAPNLHEITSKFGPGNNFRSDALQLEIAFKEKLRAFQQQESNNRFGPSPQRLGYYSQKFRTIEEYFDKICQVDQSYGRILKVIKKEYDEQIRQVGRTESDLSIVDELRRDMKTMAEALEVQRRNEKQNESVVKSLMKELNGYKQREMLSMRGGSPAMKSPGESPSPAPPIPQTSFVKSTSPSLQTPSPSEKPVYYISPTEVSELKEEIKLLRQVISEQNPRDAEILWGGTNSDRSDRSGGDAATPSPMQSAPAASSEKGDKPSNDPVAPSVPGKFSADKTLRRSNSWENLADIEGGRLFKGTPLGNIPEEKTIASLGVGTPLANIPEEESIIDTSRSLIMTDRSVRSVLSDASSMALSPRLFLAKQARPLDVPSLQFSGLADLPPSESESDYDEDANSSMSGSVSSAK